MSEPSNQDRAASPGKLCVWVENLDGGAYRLPDEFDTLEGAVAAGGQLVRADVTRVLTRVVVYDDGGRFQHKWARKSRKS